MKSGPNDNAPLRTPERAALLEYQYHQAVTGVDPRIYDDLPGDHIQMMIRIHNLYQELEAEQTKKANN